MGVTRRSSLSLRLVISPLQLQSRARSSSFIPLALPTASQPEILPRTSIILEEILFQLLTLVYLLFQFLLGVLKGHLHFCCIRSLTESKALTLPILLFESFPFPAVPCGWVHRLYWFLRWNSYSLPIGDWCFPLPLLPLILQTALVILPANPSAASWSLQWMDLRSFSCPKSAVWPHWCYL